RPAVARIRRGAALWPAGRSPGRAARDRAPDHRFAGDDAADADRRCVGEGPVGPGDECACGQRLGLARGRLVPLLPGPAVAEPGDHQPVADPDLGRRSPAVLPYRVGQGQPAERARHGCRAVRRPGIAGRADGTGLLQRHTGLDAAMTDTASGSQPRHLPRRTSTGCDMTRFPVRRLLALALASSLSLPALAQAAEPFTVRDI